MTSTINTNSKMFIKLFSMLVCNDYTVKTFLTSFRIKVLDLR